MSPAKYAINEVLRQVERDTEREELRRLEAFNSWNYAPAPTRKPGMYRSYKPFLQLLVGLAMFVGALVWVLAKITDPLIDAIRMVMGR